MLIDTCYFCGLTYDEHLCLDTRCQAGVELETKIALAAATKKLDRIFALIESHRTELYYRRHNADKDILKAIMLLKPTPTPIDLA